MAQGGATRRRRRPLRGTAHDQRAIRRTAGTAWIPLVLGLGLIALAVAGIVADVPSGMETDGGFALLAAGFGGIVGASELISRYRDAPMQAVRSPAGVTYVLTNGVVSGLTFGLLSRYSSALFPGLADDALLRSIVAGFGAMAVLRSKFFTLRTARGEDISIGPDAAVTAILDAADRGVDRARAARRLALVFARSSQITRPAAGPDFLEISIAALQNLSSDDRTIFVERMKTVVESPYPDTLKLQAICYTLISLTGEQNFADIMTNLQAYIDRLPPEEPATI